MSSFTLILSLLITSTVSQSLVFDENVITTCTPFESISSHQDIHGTSHDIGWVKIISCIEGASSFTYHWCDILSFATYAISIKFQPSSGSSNTDLTVIAKPYSNPIQAMHDGIELSYQWENPTITGLANITYWEGTATALDRLRNYRSEGPFPFTHVIYRGTDNDIGLHIMPGSHCKWEWSNTLNENIQVYLGFTPRICPNDALIVDSCCMLYLYVSILLILCK